MQKGKVWLVMILLGLLIVAPKQGLSSIERYCSTPPFITSVVTPNVLIILDNSNSMDEDFFGNAVGSYSSSSKSVVAKKALRDLVDSLRDRLRIGLMTYKLPNDVVSHYLHNSQYFTSYNPKSYCPAGATSKVCSNNTSISCFIDDDCNGGQCVDPCEAYCKTLRSEFRNICSDQCKNQNPNFEVDYFDEIITGYPLGSEERNRYCHLVYPKTQTHLLNGTSDQIEVYYKQALPMYSNSNLGTEFCYSTSYDYHEGSPYDTYKCYRNKRSTSDDFYYYSNYHFSSTFVPTDTDFALGYYDFGRRLSWYYVGQTWFSNKSPGDGFLHVPIGDLQDENGNTTTTYNNLMEKLDPKENDESGYMSCSRRDKNGCSYIVNAGLTPTAGTLQTAIDYFSGANTPIQYRCQRNFIVYVTDGLPSVDENGNTDTADNLMTSVLQKIDQLRALTTAKYGGDVVFDIRTYILGVGLTEDAKAKLNSMAVHGGTDVDGKAYFADNPEELREGLRKIFKDILKRVASGTAASILSQRSESATAVFQAVFYPKKRFGLADDAKDVDWVGYLFDWWLFVSETSSGLITNIREDNYGVENEGEEGNKILDVFNSDSTPGGDYILEFAFDNGLIINVFRSNLNGEKFGSRVDFYKGFDETIPVWEAGDYLYDYSTPKDDRNIFALIGSLTPSSPQGFGSNDVAELKSLNLTMNDISFLRLFGDEDLDGNIDETGETYSLAQSISFSDLQDFMYGIDVSGHRSRTTNEGKVWKLGDIIYSTPRAIHYNDYTVVYVGANDGMLHAFKMGSLRFDGLQAYQQVKLRNCRAGTNCDSIDELGKEMWAFIPKDVLPYLRFLADENYCHIYSVDLTPYVVPIDENGDKKPDRYILIGGMRLGGAVGCLGDHCINPPEDTCSRVCTGVNQFCSSDSDCPNNEKCVVSSNCVGLSSYFALDVTNPEDPKFLWEFNHPDLGFAYSGPAFITLRGCNGEPRHYVMFVSGPTDYEGFSDQELKIFVLELKDNYTIDGLTIIDSTTSSVLSSFNNSFGGRLFTKGIDFDEDGFTDMVFFGVTRRTGSLWQGNVIGIKTNSLNPEEWKIMKVFNSAREPVTAKIEYMKCFDMNYIFFGTGRYFFNGDDPGINNNDTERLYGVRIDKCLTEENCNINLAHSGNDACEELQNGNKAFSWYQELNPKEDGYLKERLISDPTPTDMNAIFFTTTEPTSDLCGFGGRTRIWALNCATAESLTGQQCAPYITGRITGTLFLQTSVAKISEYDIDINPQGTSPHNPFTENNNRATPWTPGVAPETPTPFFQLSSSSRGKILQWIEH